MDDIDEYIGVRSCENAGERSLRRGIWFGSGGRNKPFPRMRMCLPGTHAMKNGLNTG